jgi:hypothetical protein
MNKTLPAVVCAVMLASLLLAGCGSSTSPSALLNSPPPSIAGAWVSDVNGVRITLALTETPTQRVGSFGGPSDVTVGGSGTLTSPDRESVGFTADGLNETLASTAPPFGAVQSVLINFFALPPLPFDSSYGQFSNGAISGGTLIGEIINGSGLGPFGLQPVTAVFSRP